MEQFEQFGSMEQIELEQRLLASVVNGKADGIGALPKDFESTVFQVGAHQRIFKIITQLAVEGKHGFVEVGARTDGDSKEFNNLVSEGGPPYFDCEAIRTAGIELILRARDKNQAKAGGIDGDTYAKLSNTSQQVKVNPAQDYVNGVFYYGALLDERPYLVTSAKEIFPLHDSTKHGISPATSKFEFSQLSRETILGFLRNERKIDLWASYRQIAGYIKRFIVLKDPDAYAYLTLWVMGTYVFRAFRYYPYVHVNGEKRSGKTLLVEILKAICFNGEMSGSLTEAVIFREIESNSPTLFIDEAESLRKKDKERYGAVVGILNTGFSKSGLVKRCEGKGILEVRSYCTYSPKMFAGIDSIDDTLRDRAITIVMVRKLKSEATERYTENRSTLAFQKETRDCLYLFGLTFGPQIADLYIEHQEEIRCMDDLDNREYDVWAPILLLANTVDAARADGTLLISEQMKYYAIRQAQEKAYDEQQENETVKLLLVLRNVVAMEPDRPDGGVLYYTTERVYETFKKEDEFAWMENKTWLTRRLGKLKIRVRSFKVQGVATKFYGIDPKKLEELSNRYLPTREISVTATVSSSDETTSTNEGK